MVVGLPKPRGEVQQRSTGRWRHGAIGRSGGGGRLEPGFPGQTRSRLSHHTSRPKGAEMRLGADAGGGRAGSLVFPGLGGEGGVKRDVRSASALEPDPARGYLRRVLADGRYLIVGTAESRPERVRDATMQESLTLETLLARIKDKDDKVRCAAWQGAAAVGPAALRLWRRLLPPRRWKWGARRTGRCGRWCEQAGARVPSRMQSRGGEPDGTGGQRSTADSVSSGCDLDALGNRSG